MSGVSACQYRERIAYIRAKWCHLKLKVKHDLVQFDLLDVISNILMDFEKEQKIIN